MASVGRLLAAAQQIPVSRIIAGKVALAGAALAFSMTEPAAAHPEAQEPKCRPVVLCGPSGAGKSTLIGMLRKEFPDDYGFSVSHTTRGPRAGEQDGVDYNFVDKSLMEKEIAEGKFLESANVHGNYYGTSFEAVNRVSARNKICILDIDIQGVRSCKKAGFDADKYLFIAPPSMADLEKRLRGRGTETEDKIQKRLSGAVGEMEQSKDMQWDAYIVNDDVQKAYEKLREVTAPGRAQRALAVSNLG